jgi:broad specificity phosphatase PhoE
MDTERAKEIAVVAHGGTLRVLNAYLRGIPVERMRWEPLSNGCILRSPADWPRRVASSDPDEPDPDVPDPDEKE